MRTWREKAAPIIASVLAETRGRSEPEIRKALKDAYPFGERAYHPYKIWLDEIKRQRGTKWPVGHKQKWKNMQERVSEDQRKLQEWESVYGRRTA